MVGSVTRTAGISHSIARVVINPGYNANTLSNDTAVIQTITNMTFTAAVQPISLGAANLGGGINVVLTGFGFTGVNATLAATLQFVTLSTITTPDCRGRLSLADASRVFDNNVCTFTRLGQGACFYDAGSPLVACEFILNNKINSEIIFT